MKSNSLKFILSCFVFILIAYQGFANLKIEKVKDNLSKFGHVDSVKYQSINNDQNKNL